MVFLLHFLLAHFLADYPLQSGRLVALKEKHFWGVLIHGGIHLMVLLLIFAPLLYDGRTWGAILIVYLTHNLIDQTKVNLEKKDPLHRRFFYFLDQFLHWFILMGAAYYLGDVMPKLSGVWLEIYTNPILVLYILLLVVCTYFYDVSRHFLLEDVNKIPYQRSYKRMVINGLLVTLAFAIYTVVLSLN